MLTRFGRIGGRRFRGLLVGMLLALGLAGCDAGGAATAVPPISPPTEIPVPVADTPTTAAVPPAATPAGPGIVAELYDHAPDYSWIAGQLRQDGNCWVISYVSPLVDTPPDQYNNQLALLAGSGWNAIDFSPGAWVIAQGQPEPGTDPASGCTAHGFTVTDMRLNPKTPKTSNS